MTRLPSWHARVMRYASLHEAALACDGLGHPKDRARLVRALRKAAHSHTLGAVELVLDRLDRVPVTDDRPEWHRLVLDKRIELEREVRGLQRLAVEHGHPSTGLSIVK